MTRRSRLWVSVTPVVQVARELTSAEYRRLTVAKRAAPEKGEEFVRLEQQRQRR